MPMCFHERLKATARPGRKISFSTPCQLKGIFIKTMHGRLRSANPLQLVIIKPWQLYSKLYTLLESCCIYPYLTSSTCLPSSLHSPPCFFFQQTQRAGSLLTLKLSYHSAILVPQDHHWQSFITGMLWNHICSSYASSSPRNKPTDTQAEFGRDLPGQYIQEVGSQVRWLRPKTAGEVLAHHNGEQGRSKVCKRTLKEGSSG